MTSRAITTFSPEETRKLATDIALRCNGGEVFFLTGNLGAGKTCFVQGLASGLDIAETITSPTFTIHAQYPGRMELNHMDLYRLSDSSSVLELGFDEIAGAAKTVTAIEWPELLTGLFTCPHVAVDIATKDEMTRVLSFVYAEEHYSSLMEGIA